MWRKKRGAAPSAPDWPGPAIARLLGRPLSTVGVVLRRRGLGRLAGLDVPPPVRRYEREWPDKLIRIDSKKLGRIDHRITGDRTGQSSRRAAGLRFGRRGSWPKAAQAAKPARRHRRPVAPDVHAVAAQRTQGRCHCLTQQQPGLVQQLGVVVERVMTDNHESVPQRDVRGADRSSAYKSRKLTAALHAKGITHKRSRPIRLRPTARLAFHPKQHPRVGLLHAVQHLG